VNTKVAGIGIVALAIWGGLVPFVGPTFGFSMGTTGAWTWTAGRAELHVAPAIVALLGGLALLGFAGESRRRLGAFAAAIAGMWFVLAPTLQPLWTNTASASGGHMMGMSGMSGMGSSTTSVGMTALQGVGYHYGTGVLLAVLGAFAVGALARRTSAETVAAPAEASPRRRFAPGQAASEAS